MIYVICYMDTNSNDHFETTTDINAWSKAHPYAEIHYIFEEKSDLQSRTNNLEWNFLQYCNQYGLKSNMLHCLFTNKHGHMCELLGMNPANRKYKFIIMDKTAGKKYKVTADYILTTWPFTKTLTTFTTPKS